MISFFYRNYSKARGAFYNGDEDMLARTMDSTKAKTWWKENHEFIREIEITLPPRDNIIVRIPVKEDGDEDTEFEQIVLSDLRIDPKIRIIVNKILISYKYCKGGFFVARSSDYHKKMNTKNMEVLQLMKDVIMGFIRYEPIKLDYYVGKGAKKKRVEYEWDITKDFKNVTYFVGGRKYKTDIFGTYTWTLRKAMFKHDFEFYGNHELQYFQREFDLNYGANNYMCASRDSGKTFYGLYNTAVPMFKSVTTRREAADSANMKCHFYTLAQDSIGNYAEKLKGFFKNLLVDTYGLGIEAANQIVSWKNSNYTMALHTADGDRKLQFVSEQATSKRGERSARITLDECNYLKNYEDVADFADKSGAGSVNYISTISLDSKTSLFYKKRVQAMVKTRNNKPIDEIIHHIRIKYKFHKMKSAKDYVKMVKDGTMEKARAEYYKMRTTYAMKVTLDSVEYKSEDEKIVDVESAIDSPTGYDGMLAEYYCELVAGKPVINYRPNIIDSENIPSFFEKIYVGYDEAEEYDDPAIVVGGVLKGKLYVIGQYILPVQIGKRYAKMKEIIQGYESMCKIKPSMIVDVGRGNRVFREAYSNVGYTDRAIKALSGDYEKELKSQGVVRRSVGTKRLVGEIMNIELIKGDLIFFSDKLSSSLTKLRDEGGIEVPGLLGQLDNYVLEKGSYKGKGRSADDLVSALLYMAYYAYQDTLKEGAQMTGEPITDPLLIADYNNQKIMNEINTPKTNKALRSMW